MESKKEEVKTAAEPAPASPPAKLTIEEEKKATLLKVKKARVQYAYFPFFFRALFTFLRMERDAQMLANRIALLKQEESKTRKKIEETKKKSKEILAKKQRMEERNTKVRWQ